MALSKKPSLSSRKSNPSPIPSRSLSSWIRRRKLLKLGSVTPCLLPCRSIRVFLHSRHLYQNFNFNFTFILTKISYQLTDYISEIPATFRKDLQVTHNLFDRRMAAISTISEEIVTGKKKDEMMQWWLKTIEAKVDEFILTVGFTPNSIPYDYTNVPPEDVTLVEKNLQILEDLVKGGSGQIDFIQRTTEEIYVMIDPFIEEMGYVVTLSKVKIWIILKYF